MKGLTADRAVARTLHPGAWWLWALALAAFASRTTNPLLLMLTIALAGLVVTQRRGQAPWSLAFRYYLAFGAVIVLARVLFRVLFSGAEGDTVLVSLPTIPLPEFAAGIELLGDVSAESVLGGAYDGLRLATMVICLGAANALANPKRMLRALPSALYEVGTAVVVALSVAPQLIESVLRVRRARRLRGAAQRGMAGLRAIVLPVLADALDASLSLAAAMDSRGYGRTGSQPRRQRLLTSGLLLAGLGGICVGIYGALDRTGGFTSDLGGPALLAGVAVAGLGMWLSGRRLGRTRYRPDPWRSIESVVVACGVVALLGSIVVPAGDAVLLNPPVDPLTWPQLPILPTIALLVAALPAWIAPPPPRPARTARPKVAVSLA